MVGISNPVYLGNLYYFNNGTTFNKDKDTTWTKFKEDIIPIVNYDTYFGESNRNNRDKSAAVPILEVFPLEGIDLVIGYGWHNSPNAPLPCRIVFSRKESF